MSEVKKKTAYCVIGRGISKKSVDKLVLLDELLTGLPRQLLDMLNHHNVTSHYLSHRDLKRMLPYPADKIDCAVSCLYDLGSIGILEQNGTSFYCLPNMGHFLKSNIQEAVISDKAEQKITQIVHGLVMKLFPDALMLKPNPADSNLSVRDMKLSKPPYGISFDIFYEFRSPVSGVKFFAADVYSRILVTDHIVRSFVRKIERATDKTSEKQQRNGHKAETAKKKTEGRHCPLRGKTLGTLIYHTIDHEAVAIAKNKRISLLSLEDLKIDCDAIREQVCFDINSNR